MERQREALAFPRQAPRNGNEAFLRFTPEIASAAWARWTGWERKTGRWLQWVVPVLLVAYLAYSLAKIGLIPIWTARPTSPAFYFCLIAPFFIPPYADALIYRNLLKAGKKLRYAMLLRKQCINGVLDYSGEAYFFLWCRQNLNLQTRDLLHPIKDSNVLSASAGLATLLLVLVVLVALGGLSPSGFLPVSSWTLLPLTMLPLLLSIVLVVGGRRVTTLSRAQIAFTFAIHAARSGIVLILTFAMWWFSGALPSAVLCLQFVALRLLITRLPFVPNTGLIFTGAAIAAASAMNISQPRVAAVALIGAAFSQGIGIAVVGLPWLLERVRPNHDTGPLKPALEIVPSRASLQALEDAAADATL